MKNIVRLVSAIGLFIALAFGQAGAVVWVSPVGDAAGPTGYSNVKINGGLASNGGQNVVGSVIQRPIGTPSAPTMTTNGTAGATSLVYACTAFDFNGQPAAQDSAGADNPGQTIPSATATITTANATLSATNSVNITCGGQVGALGYLIHKVDTGHVIGYCYANSNGQCVFVDTGTYQNGNGGATQTSSFTYTANTVDETSGNACSGQATMAAGVLLVTAPCASNSTYCSCSVVGKTVAVVAAAGGCGCIPTSTATVISSATVTVAAVAVAAGATPATSPVINWWAGPR